MRNRRSSTFDNGRRRLGRTLPKRQPSTEVEDLFVEVNVVHHFESEGEIAEETVDTE